MCSVTANLSTVVRGIHAGQMLGYSEAQWHLGLNRNNSLPVVRVLSLTRLPIVCHLPPRAGETPVTSTLLLTENLLELTRIPR